MRRRVTTPTQTQLSVMRWSPGHSQQYPYGKGDGPPEKDKINAAVITPRLAAVTN